MWGGAQMEFEPCSPPAEGLVEGALRKYLNEIKAQGPETAKLMVYSQSERGRGVPFIDTAKCFVFNQFIDRQL